MVTAITGVTRYRIELQGRADHAGGTPMAERCDALAGAAQVIAAMERLWIDGAGVGTVGRLTVSPNSINVVPETVTMWTDMRSLDGALLDARREAFAAEAGDVAGQRGLRAVIDLLSREEPVPADPAVGSVLAEAAGQTGRPYLRLPSHAGHDANQMAKIAPVGMLFAPSQGGRASCRRNGRSRTTTTARSTATCSSRACTTGAGRSPRGRPGRPAQHSRIYWYVVGKMDEWDLNDPKAEARLRSRFELNPRLRDSYLEDVGRRLPDLPAERRHRGGLEPLLRRDPRVVREQAPGPGAEEAVLPRRPGGDRLRRDPPGGALEGRPAAPHLNEKGLDTSLAVDMVALQDTYDIALLISGDADGIPGINYVKGRSKHVGVAEFRRGAPADFPAKGASSRLKIAADFVVQVYEADLIRRNLAYRSEPDYRIRTAGRRPAHEGNLLIDSDGLDRVSRTAIISRTSDDHGPSPA